MSYYISIVETGTVKLTGDRVLLKGCKVAGDGSITISIIFLGMTCLRTIPHTYQK
jgi:hypothetical protein